MGLNKRICISDIDENNPEKEIDVFQEVLAASCNVVVKAISGRVLENNTYFRFLLLIHSQSTRSENLKYRDWKPLFQE